MSEDDDDTIIPPMWVPLLPDMPRWVQRIWDIGGAAITRDLLLGVRRQNFPIRSRILFPDGRKQEIENWEDVPLVDWDTGHALDREGNRYRIEVFWDTVTFFVEGKIRGWQKDDPTRRLESAGAAPPESDSCSAPVYQSGTAGRPTSINLIAIELERRRKAGEVLLTRNAESEALSAWLTRIHPGATQTTPKSIRTSAKLKLSEAVTEAKCRE